MDHSIPIAVAGLYHINWLGEYLKGVTFSTFRPEITSYFNISGRFDYIKIKLFPFISNKYMVF